MQNQIAYRTCQRLIELRRQGATITELAATLRVQYPFRLIMAFRKHPELHYKPEEIRNAIEWEMWFGSTDGFKPRPASTPTQTQPGSAAKIEILRERYANGEELFHRDDRRRKPRWKPEPWRVKLFDHPDIDLPNEAVA